jgi:predicted amino acid racemase
VRWLIGSQAKLTLAEQLSRRRLHGGAVFLRSDVMTINSDELADRLNDLLTGSLSLEHALIAFRRVTDANDDSDRLLAALNLLRAKHEYIGHLEREAITHTRQIDQLENEASALAAEVEALSIALKKLAHEYEAREDADA